MTSTFNSSGITLDRYSDILDRLEALAVIKWGEGIDTSEDEFYGHLLRLISTLVSEINEILQSVYDAGSVANSSGVALANNVELIGLSFNEAAYSTVTLTLTSTAPTTVPAGTQYGTSAGAVFATDTELVFAAAGSDTVAATCTVVGSNDAEIGEVNVIINARYGITTCTNAAAATPGRLQETSPELKERHSIAVSTSGDEDAASIYEAISGVAGVSAAYIYDNDTNEYVGMIPPHNINCSAIGGTDIDIATAIAGAKTSGVPTYGLVSEEVYNPVTRQARDINFDRAANTDTHIIVNISTIDRVFPGDGVEQIKTNLVSHFTDININDDVLFTALYAPIYTVSGVIVNSMFLGTSDPPAGTANLASDSLIRYTLSIDDIDISVT